MKVKFMAVSGSTDPWEAEQLAGKSLGVLYRLQEDEIYFVLRPGVLRGQVEELRRRVGGCATGPDTSGPAPGRR